MASSILEIFPLLTFAVFAVERWKKGSLMLNRGGMGSLIVLSFVPKYKGSKMQLTHKALLKRAQKAIDKREELVFDVCSEYGQMFDNVKEMKWLLIAVANELIMTVKKWEDLDPIPS